MCCTSIRSAFCASGRVVTSHPMFGMGIAFDEEHHEIEQRLTEQAPDKQNITEQPPVFERCAEQPPQSSADVVFSKLLRWFAGNATLDRTKFFELVHSSAKK